MLLKAFLKEASSRLEGLYPTAEAKNIVLMLCGDRLGTKSYTHLVDPEYPVKDKLLEPLMADLDRLAAGEPIQYVLGFEDFCGLRFKVTPDVLIPRPETEILCREAIKVGSRLQRQRKAYGDAYPVRVLDLCTGSGCIAWTVALNIPGAVVTGVDISEKALMVAMGQDFSASLKETGAVAPRFMIADVLGGDLPLDSGQFDLILSNPPYIMESQKESMRPNVLDHEPSIALFVPDDDPLVFHQAIARISRGLLSTDGIGMTEINELLGPDTQRVFSGEGFSRSQVIKDFYAKDRFILYSK